MIVETTNGPFGPPVGPPAPGLAPPGQLPPGSGDPVGYLQGLPPTTRLIDIAPSLAERTGSIDLAMVPSVCLAAVAKNARSWDRLREVTIDEMLSWPGVGVVKAARLVSFVRELSAPPPIARDERDAIREIAGHVVVLATWAVARGATHHGLETALLAASSDEAPPEVVAARDALDELDLGAVASDTLLARFDPTRAATALLGEFTDRRREVLERILAKGLRPVATLEEIGEVWGVTRERVRQIEAKVRGDLARLLESPTYAVVRRHADQLADRLGAVVHLAELPPEMAPDGAGLTDELYTWLAGPYVLHGEWLVRRDAGDSPSALLRGAYESAADGFAAPVDAVTDALEAAGIRPTSARRLIEEADGWKILHEQVFHAGSVKERLLGTLQVVGRPMSFEELKAEMLDGSSETTLRNLLFAAPEVKRIKVDQWALTAWEGEAYTTILEHMAQELTHGGRSIAQLADELEDRFGISPVSVQMYAAMHPQFVAAAGTVRMRREDEPYVPTASLELTGGCFVVDGAWSLAVKVDHDLLRGSGRWMPDAFAVHLGLQPGAHGALDCGDRQLKVTWGMKPSFGSLRWVAEREGLAEGDLLFIRRSTPSSLDFRYVRRDEIDAAEPSQQLRLRVGGGPSSGDILRVVGDALGLGGATTPTPAQVIRRLETRGEATLVKLLREAVAT